MMPHRLHLAQLAITQMDFLDKVKKACSEFVLRKSSLCFFLVKLVDIVKIHIMVSLCGPRAYVQRIWMLFVILLVRSISRRLLFTHAALVGRPASLSQPGGR